MQRHFLFVYKVKKLIGVLSVNECAGELSWASSGSSPLAFPPSPPSFLCPFSVRLLSPRHRHPALSVNSDARLTSRYHHLLLLCPVSLLLLQTVLSLLLRAASVGHGLGLAVISLLMVYLDLKTSLQLRSVQDSYKIQTRSGSDVLMAVISRVKIEKPLLVWE